MSRFKCEKKEPCVHCGGCCHFRDKSFLTDEEDAKIKGQIYLKTGIIYLYPFSRYTITVTKEEKEAMHNAAKKHGVKISILPKKVYYDADNDKVHVIDYFVDHDVCPLWKDNRCSSYEIRPEICKQFPNITMEHNVDIEKLTGHKQIRLLNMPYKDIQEVMIEKLEKNGIKC